MSFLEDLVFPTVVRPHDDSGSLLETRVLYLEDEAVQFRLDEASIVGDLLVVVSVDLAVALDIEEHPGFKKKMTGFVESP